MRKWKTNDVALQEKMTDVEDESKVKVLGMDWNTDTDKFGFDVSSLMTNLTVKEYRSLILMEALRRLANR